MQNESSNRRVLQLKLGYVGVKLVDTDAINLQQASNSPTHPLVPLCPSK